jgi:hypothetical protein
MKTALLRTDYANLFAELFCLNLELLHTPEFLAKATDG